MKYKTVEELTTEIGKLIKTVSTNLADHPQSKSEAISCYIGVVDGYAEAKGWKVPYQWYKEMGCIKEIS